MTLSTPSMILFVLSQPHEKVPSINLQTYCSGFGKRSDPQGEVHRRVYSNKYLHADLCCPGG